MTVFQTKLVTAQPTLLFGSQGGNTTPMLIVNRDSVNSIFIGDVSNVNADGSNSVELGPGESAAFSGAVSIYAVAVSGNVQVSVIPSGSSFFQPTTLANLGGAKVFVQNTEPTGNIPLNSIWFDTTDNALLTWDGATWVNEAFNAQSLIQAATILGTQIADQTITAQQIGSLSASLIGNLGTLNANPYFTGGDGTGWAAYQGTFSVTGSPPAGAPFAYAGEFVNNGVSNGAMEESASGSQFPVSVSTHYLVTAWVYSSSGSCQIGFDWTDNGAYVSTSPQIIAVPVNTWTQVTTVQKSPSSGVNAGYARIGPNALNATIYAQAVTVLPQVPGSLIQAGTLTTAQLAAAAGILGTQIANATITSGNIAANTIVAANIAANTITAAELAAGIVYAGIVDTTTITGAKLVIGQSSSPGGNLNIDASGITFAQVSGPAGDTSQVALSMTDVPPAAQNPYLAIAATDITTGRIVTLYIGPEGIIATAPIAAWQPSINSAETWHPITLDAGWAAAGGFDAPRYRLLPDGNLQLSGAASRAVFTAGVALNSGTPLPAAYRPVNTHHYRAYDTSTGTARCGVQIDSTGVITALATAASSAGFCEIDGIIPLN